MKQIKEISQKLDSIDKFINHNNVNKIISENSNNICDLNFKIAELKQQYSIIENGINIINEGVETTRNDVMKIVDENINNLFDKLKKCENDIQRIIVFNKKNKIVNSSNIPLFNDNLKSTNSTKVYSLPKDYEEVVKEWKKKKSKFEEIQKSSNSQLKMIRNEIEILEKDCENYRLMSENGNSKIERLKYQEKYKEKLREIEKKKSLLKSIYNKRRNDSDSSLEKSYFLLLLLYTVELKKKWKQLKSFMLME